MLREKRGGDEGGGRGRENDDGTRCLSPLFSPTARRLSSSSSPASLDWSAATWSRCRTVRRLMADASLVRALAGREGLPPSEEEGPSPAAPAPAAPATARRATRPPGLCATSTRGEDVRQRASMDSDCALSL